MGINSLILQELSLRKGDCNGLDLDLLSLSEGETGTNLQLCYAKLCSEIVGIGQHLSPEEIRDIDYTSLSEPPWSDLLRLIARYPDTTQYAFEKLDPGTILFYLFSVVDELNTCLAIDESGKVEAEGESSAAGLKYIARAVLYENVRQVLENGMKLLGATPISK